MESGLRDDNVLLKCRDTKTDGTEGQRQAKSALIGAPPCSDPSLINAWGAAVVRAKAQRNGTGFEEFE